LVELAHLEGKELKLQLVSNGLLISPEKEARDGWKETIEQVIAIQGQETLDQEWLDPSLASDGDLEW